MTDSRGLDTTLDGRAWEPNPNDARAQRRAGRLARESVAPVATTRVDGDTIVSTDDDTVAEIDASRRAPAERDPTERSQGFAAAAIEETPGGDGRAAAPIGTPMVNSSSVQEQSADVIRDQPGLSSNSSREAAAIRRAKRSAVGARRGPRPVGRDRGATAVSMSDEEFSGRIMRTLQREDVGQFMAGGIRNVISAVEEERDNARAEEQRGVSVSDLSDNINAWMSVDSGRASYSPAPAPEHSVSSPQIQHEDSAMPQDQQFAGATGGFAPGAAQPSIAEVMAQMNAQLSALNLRLDQQERVIADKDLQINGLNDQLNRNASANQRQPDDARFGADPSGRASLGPNGQFQSATSHLSGSAHQFYSPTGPSPMQFQTPSTQPPAIDQRSFGPEGFPAPSPYDTSQDPGIPHHQTYGTGAFRGQGDGLVDLSQAFRPNRPIVAGQPIELTLTSSSAEREVVTRQLGLVIDKAGFAPRGDGRLVGTNKYVLPPGGSVDQAWDHLADGHKCDAIRTGESDRGNQHIVLQSSGWSQGKDMQGQVFTYKSEAGPALDLNDKTYKALSPQMQKQIVMGAAGYDETGNWRLGTYHAKAGQAIEPLAHMLSKTERSQLNAAGLGHVHAQADRRDAERTRNVLARFQGNPQLASYGREVIAPNFAYGNQAHSYGNPAYGPSTTGYSTGIRDQTPRVSSQYSAAMPGPAFGQGQAPPFYPVTPARQAWQAQPYGDPGTGPSTGQPYQHSAQAGGLDQQTPTPIRYGPPMPQVQQQRYDRQPVSHGR